MTDIFDIHIHVQPWAMMKPAARELMMAQAASLMPVLEDADSLVRHLDREGVAAACCINYVSPDVMGFSRDTIQWIANFTRNHRDRLYPVGSVNPLHESNARDEIRRVLDLGMRMIKIHPPHQLFAANGYLDAVPGLADVYRECELRNIPVMIHTGTSIFPKARNRFADPMGIDDVAIDFPDLKIVMAHAGRPLYGETAFFLVRRHPNVHVDISGIPPQALDRFFPRLESVYEKVLWGTDWPSPGIPSMRKNIDAFLAARYSDEVKGAVLGGNARRLFAASA